MAEQADVWAGVYDGAGRFCGAVDQVSTSQLGPLLQEAFDLAWGVTESRPEWHARGARLFAEVVAVGVLSRWRFEEPSLASEDAYQFAQSIEALGNSFFHLHLP